MIKSKVLIIGFPDELCKIERVDLKVLMSRALRIEARMIKGVKLEDEEKRYDTLCDRIEFYGNLIASASPASTELDSSYLETLVKIQAMDEEAFRGARLGANFCPAEGIGNQIKLTTNLIHNLRLPVEPNLVKKLKFYQRAQANHWNVIELLEVDAGPAEERTIDAAKLHQDFLALKVAEGVEVNQNAYVGLANQFRTAIASLRRGQPASINFSDIGHNVITETLHQFVYGKYQYMLVPVMYADGSEAPALPINALAIRDQRKADTAFKDEPILNIGMISQRHYEMDPIVKMYFFRNQEISTGKTAGEIDRTAYEKAKWLFQKTRGEGIYRIAFYQTGFQPAVVGFYRALTEELMFRAKEAPTLQVIPYFYLHEKYVEGKIWM